MAAVVAAVAAVLAVAALVVVLIGDDPPPAPTGGGTPVPTVAGRPPTEVALADEGEVITVTWRDPAAGRVSFIVAGGRSGQQLGAMGQLGPGTTKYSLTGLSPRLDYCFSVVAVYGPDQLAPSTQVCTTRAGSPAPRPSR